MYTCAVRCALCGVRCAVCAVRCALCSVHCALCSVQPIDLLMNYVMHMTTPLGNKYPAVTHQVIDPAREEIILYCNYAIIMRRAVV